MTYFSELKARAKSHPGSIALPEILDQRILQAAIQLISEQCMHTIHTLTPQDHVEDAARKFQLNLDGIREHLRFEEHLPDSIRLDTQSTILQKSGHLLRNSLVDSVLAGATHATADVIRAAISSVGLAPGLKTISGSFIMNRSLPDGREQTFLFADCGVVIAPTVAQLCDIAAASVATWQSVSLTDQDPVVAFLSFSTKGSAKHSSVEKINEAVAQFRTMMPDVLCDGEIQFDAAIDAQVGLKKGAAPEVAGHANIFIFPDLNAGNIAYKVAQRLGGFNAIGPVLQGAGRIFSDLSRGATTADIIMGALLNQVRANQQRAVEK